MFFYALESFESAYLRSFCAFFTSFVVAIISGKYIIHWLKEMQKEGQPIREDGPDMHLVKKKGIPTMGGFIILAAVLCSVLLWNRLDSLQVHMLVVMGLLGASIGFWDDYKKIRSKNSYGGMSNTVRITLEALLGLLLFMWLYFLEPTDYTTSVTIPFFRGFEINLGLFYAIFAMFIMTSTTNTVNFSDGLDGLAGGLMLIAIVTFGFIAWFASYLGSSFIMEVSPVVDGEEIMIFCFALSGALLGFLWYNAYPAKVFMGDVGSLALGAILGTLAIILKQELLLIIIGGVFVMEGISDIIQILYYKKTKKRFFLMAPLHHHFEKKGMHEVSIVIRFWIMGIICSVIAFVSIYRNVE